LDHSKFFKISKKNLFIYLHLIFSINFFSKHVNRHITLKHEASCLDICFFKDKFGETIILLAIGLWTDTSIKIFKLPDFVELVKEPLFEGNK